MRHLRHRWKMPTPGAGVHQLRLPPTIPVEQAGDPGQTLLGLTWRLKSLCSNPFLGGAVGWPFQSRSGGTDPSSPKTLSSWKHSVSTIYPGTGSCESWPQGCPTQASSKSQDNPYLVLPGDGHTARGKLLVEVLVCGLQIHTFNCRELFNVQDILAVDGLGLRRKRQESGRLESSSPWAAPWFGERHGTPRTPKLSTPPSLRQFSPL